MFKRFSAGIASTALAVSLGALPAASMCIDTGMNFWCTGGGEKTIVKAEEARIIEPDDQQRGDDNQGKYAVQFKGYYNEGGKLTAIDKPLVIVGFKRKAGAFKTLNVLKWIGNIEALQDADDKTAWPPKMIISIAHVKYEKPALREDCYIVKEFSPEYARFHGAGARR